MPPLFLSEPEAVHMVMLLSGYFTCLGPCSCPLGKGQGVGIQGGGDTILLRGVHLMIKGFGC